VLLKWRLVGGAWPPGWESSDGCAANQGADRPVGQPGCCCCYQPDVKPIDMVIGQPVGSKRLSNTKSVINDRLCHDSYRVIPGTVQVPYCRSGIRPFFSLPDPVSKPRELFNRYPVPAQVTFSIRPSDLQSNFLSVLRIRLNFIPDPGSYFKRKKSKFFV
jgi:hypothetical protein